jgi:MFS family permease
MDLVCSSDFMLGLFGALYFAGLALGAICFSRLADILGRKYLSIFALFISVITGVVILIVND